MKKLIRCLVIVLCLVGFLMPTSLLAGKAKVIETVFDFENEQDNQKLVLQQYGNRLEPQIQQGILMLVYGSLGANHKNVALFPQVTEGLYNDVQLSWKMYITPGAEGCGFAFLNTDIFNADSLDLNFDKWQEPNIKGSFAIGFDISNPPTSSWYSPDGNYYDRPQREISLHWDGLEQVKKVSPVEFRSNPDEKEEAKEFRLNIHYVIGGAEVSLFINDTAVYDSYFIAGMTPYPGRLSVGAQTGEFTTNVFMDDLALKYENPVRKVVEPIRVNVMDEQPVYRDFRKTQHQVVFPKIKEDIGRIILTLTLDSLAAGYDPWDEGGHIYVWADSVRYEICRFITPYNRGYMWKVDVTDFMPLLTGEKQFDLFVGTWLAKAENPAQQKGWKISVELDFYPGKPKRIPYKIVKLWDGELEYGNPEDPMINHLKQMNIDVPEDAKDARVRFMVTGHGMGPNSKGAGEFMPADRTVYVNGHEFENRLWKTDCYLNPCRPQGGTWKFDRTGWAPGSVVKPWIIELKDIAKPGENLKIDYVPAAYRNLSEGDHYKAHHNFATQLIFYK